jgi:hypothetical protein
MMNATGLVNNGAAVIAVGGSNVYWNEFVTSGMMANATIQECATTGCRDSPTALSPGFGAAMVADGQNVYWTTGYNATVMECPIGGCGKASVQLWSGEANQITAGIAVDETDVYWLTYLGDLFKCSKTGCNVSRSPATCGGGLVGVAREWRRSAADADPAPALTIQPPSLDGARGPCGSGGAGALAQAGQRVCGGAWAGCPTPVLVATPARRSRAYHFPGGDRSTVGGGFSGRRGWGFV